MISSFETSTKPIIAAIHGNALGGGLETALACHYRCGTADSLYGLPEVLIGILPGGQGTQRLPRVCGVEKALPLMVSGEFVPAPKALTLGIIDHVVENNLVEGAVAFAKQVSAENRPLRKIREESVAPPAADFFDTFEKSIGKRSQKKGARSAQMEAKGLPNRAKMEPKGRSEALWRRSRHRSRSKMAAPHF